MPADHSPLHPLTVASRLDHILPFYAMEVAKQAAELEATGRKLIHMGIGEPDFTAPEPVIRAAELALRKGATQYTHALGIAPLREAIAAYYRRVYQLDIAPERIIVTAGASAALLLACAVLVEPGRDVLMPDPSYPCNRHFVAAFEGAARLIPSGPEQRYQLSASQVAEHWCLTTAGVLLASPSNPTGTSIAPDALAEILRVVAARGGFAIVDEIYQGLSYDAPPVSALSLDDNTVTINSFSKYFSMTGWRLGWLVAPHDLVPQFEKLAQNLFICPSALAQHAALACFDEDALSIYEARRVEFKQRRDYLVPALRKLGFGVPVIPDGAFYVYADCRGIHHPHAGRADQLARSILHDAGVVLVPGMDFGPYTAHSHLRFSYATAMTDLQEAVQRLTHLFAR